MTSIAGTPSRVAVIIPFYNGSSKLAATIESVKRQTFPAYEIIVVDDGSSEHEAQWLRDLQADFPFRLIAQPNAGPAAARNTGIRATEAPLVAFLDADDLWAPDKLAEQVQAFDADGSLQLCICDSLTVNDDGEVTARNAFSRYRDARALVNAAIGNEVHSITSAIMFRRLQDDGRPWLMDEGLRYREDHEFLIRLLLAGPSMLLDKALSSRVVHQGSYSHASTSSYVNFKMQYDDAFFAALRGAVAQDALLLARVNAIEHDTFNKIILGRKGDALRNLRAYAALLPVGTSAKLLMALGISIGRPGHFDYKDKHLAAVRRSA